MLDRLRAELGQAALERLIELFLGHTEQPLERLSEAVAAIVCLARRRCDVIHAMLRAGLTYGELPSPARPATPEPEIALAA